jgi:hypothetical protein
MDCLQPFEAESTTLFQSEVRYTKIFLTLKGGPLQLSPLAISPRQPCLARTP